MLEWADTEASGVIGPGDTLWDMVRSSQVRAMREMVARWNS